MNTLTDNEISAFHARFCPFAERLYRSALIVTGHPRRAKQLQVDVYLKAFVEYLHAGRLDNFKKWLAGITLDCFADYELQRAEVELFPQAVYEIVHMTLEKFVDCRKASPRQDPFFTT